MRYIPNFFKKQGRILLFVVEYSKKDQSLSTTLGILSH
jgi:hypothetical protein